MIEQGARHEEVAYITFRTANREAEYTIVSNDEFDIGRQLVEDVLGIKDGSISTHHVRIHCITYGDEQEDEPLISPLVYMRVLSKNAVVLRRSESNENSRDLIVGISDRDVLLNNGDLIQLTSQVLFSFTTIVESPPPSLDRLQRCEVGRFAHQYRLSERVLGVGAQAAVYVAVKQSTGQQLACKVVPLLRPKSVDELISSAQPISEKLAEFREKQRKIAREYNVLRRLSHPNIITLEKVFRTSHNIFLFEELITGGDLTSYLSCRGPLSEPQSVIIVRQLLEAVNYLHANQVVHRDIKPENILMTSWRDGARVVLTDFGMCRTVTDLESAAQKAGVLRMHSFAGTAGYTAPEVYDYVKQKVGDVKQKVHDGSGYSEAIDIWSIGCVTGMLLTSRYIFPDIDHEELRTGTVALSRFTTQLEVLDTGEEWMNVDLRAKSFVRGCLITNAESRLTAAECLQLPWFQHHHYREEFDALYRRSIQDWTPRAHDEHIIEMIDTSDIKRPKDPGGLRSRHFPALRPTTLTPAPDVFSKREDTLARFRAHNQAANPTHDSGATVGTPFDELSPIPAPPTMPSARVITRAHNWQRQYVSESMFDTQSLMLPPPPPPPPRPTQNVNESMFDTQKLMLPPPVRLSQVTRRSLC